MHAETQQYYIMPDANIARIAWSEPRLHYDFFRKAKKTLSRKIFGETEELSKFRNINRDERFSVYDNIIMYKEKFILTSCKYFGIKFQGNNLYKHFNVESECTIRDGVYNVF